MSDCDGDEFPVCRLVLERGHEQKIVELPCFTTVPQLKTVVASKFDLPEYDQVLVFDNKKLDNNKQLWELGIKNLATIRVCERQGSGPPGGRCLFNHGLVATPMPAFVPFAHCCEPYVRFEFLECKELHPLTEAISVKFYPVLMSGACHPKMYTYLEPGGLLHVECDGETLLRTEFNGKEGCVFLPQGGWKPDALCTVSVTNASSRGVGWTFKTA